MAISAPQNNPYVDPANSDALDSDQDLSQHPELLLEEDGSYETALETEGAEDWEDAYLSEENPLGDSEPEGTANFTPSSVRDQLIDLAQRKVISQEVYFAYITRLNRAGGLSGSEQQALLSQIMGELSAQHGIPVESPDPLLGDLSELEQDSEAGSVVEEIQQFVKKVQENEKLSEGNKKTLVAEAEKLLTEAEGIETGSEAEYTLEEKFSELSDRLTKYEEMPGNAEDLAKRYHRSESEILDIAEKHGLDLAKLPEPPSAEVFNFLAELDSRLAKAYETAKAGPGKKAAMDNEMVNRAQKSSQNNASSTTNSTPDNVDWDSFFYLDAARDYKDRGSQQFILQPYRKVTRMLAQDLKALYPDAKIRTKNENDIKSVDIIEFGDQEIDVLSNTTGEFQSATAGNDVPPPPPPMVTLLYDWEGDGDWEDSDSHRNQLNKLKDHGYPTQAYDSPIL